MINHKDLAELHSIMVANVDEIKRPRTKEKWKVKVGDEFVFSGRFDFEIERKVAEIINNFDKRLNDEEFIAKHRD